MWEAEGWSGSWHLSCVLGRTCMSPEPGEACNRWPWWDSLGRRSVAQWLPTQFAEPKGAACRSPPPMLPTLTGTAGGKLSLLQQDLYQFHS